jgi:autotransporter-associated beta strand protein
MWTGGGGVNTDWSDAPNWNAGVPANNGSVMITFSSASPFTSTVDTTFSVAEVQVASTAGALVLTSSGGATLNAGAGFFYASANSVAFDVAMTGTGEFLLNGGTGTLTMNPGAGANVFSGSTQVFAGGTLADGENNSFSPNSELDVGGGGTPGHVLVNFNETILDLGDVSGGNGTVTVASTKTLTINGGVTNSYSGIITGSGGLEKDGTSTQVLTGANTYTGPTVVGFGATIQLGSGGTTGSITSDVSGLGGLSFDRSNPYVYSNALSGSLGIAQQGTGTTTLSGANTYSGATTVNNGTLQAGSTSAFGGATGLSFVSVNASGTLALNGFNNTIGWLGGSGAVSLGSSTLTVAYPTSSTTFSGLITGAGGSLVSSGQTLELSGGNTYTGTTTITSGSTLIADNSLGFATGTGPLVIASGGTLQVGPGGEMPLGIISNSSISNSGTLSFTNSTNQTFGGNISGAGVLNQFGSGTLTLAGNNSFSGFTQVEFGVLAAGSTTAFGGAGNSNFTLESGAVLVLGVFSNSIGSIQGDSSTLIDMGGGGTTLTIAGNNQTSPFMGTIQGGGGINLTGVNAVTTLSGANTYTGGTTIASGFLIADNATGSATGTGNITVDPVSILQIGNTDTGGSVAAPNITNNGTIELARTDSTTLASNISGTGGISMLASGNFTLTGNNSYSGPTFIVGGKLTAGSGTAFGNGLSAVDIIAGGTMALGSFANSVGSVTGDSTTFINLGTGELTTGALNTTTTFAGVISGAGVFEVVGSSETILTGANTFTGGISIPGTGGTVSIGNVSTPGASIVSNVLDEGTLIFAPAISDNLTYPGSITGIGSVNFAGSGTIILSGANTYSGPTTVASGTLADGATNAFSPTSSMQVAAAGHLTVNFNETVGDLTNDPGLGGGPVVIAAGKTLSSSGIFYVDSSNDYLGAISGGGSLSIINGVQGLAGNNTYSGGTSVSNSAEIFVGTNTALGTGTLTMFPGTELSPDANVTLANPIVFSGGATLDNDDGGANGLTLAGQISEVGGAGSIEWCTTGILALLNANTFTGGVDMREGTLLLGNDTAAGSGTITLDSGTILSAYGTGVTRNISNDLNLTGSTQLGNNDNNNLILSGTLTGNVPIAYVGGPTGTLKLTAASTTDGGFTIDSGTVIAGNNNAFGSNPNQIFLNGGVTLNVMNGVTISNHLNFAGSSNVLTGNGQINSGLSVDNTVVLSPRASPGNGPGLLVLNGGVTLATGGTIDFDMYDATGAIGTGYSGISSPFGVNLTANPGSLTFNLISTDSSGNAANAINFNSGLSYSWMFLQSGFPVSGFNSNQFNLNTSGFSNATGGGTFALTVSGDDLFLNFTPVPEPSTWALMGAGLLALVPFALRRRRMARA